MALRSIRREGRFINVSAETRIAAAIAALLGLCAIALACLAIFDVTPFIASHSPDGNVSAAYVASFRHRAAACAIGVALIAIAVMAFGSLPARRQAAAIQGRQQAAALLYPIVILAVAAIARASLLTMPLHYDEAFTITEYSTKSPLFFLSVYSHPNNHLFHTLLSAIALRIGGHHAAAARIPAFLAGLGVVGVTYTVALRRYGRAAAAVAAALAAGSAPLVQYSAEARGHMIVALCFLGLLLVDHCLVAAALIAIGVWTIPTMAYAAIGWGLWRLAVARDLRVFIVAAISAALTFLVYVPVIVVSGIAPITSNGNVLPVPRQQLLHAMWRNAVETFASWNASFTIAGAVLIAIAVLISIVLRRTHAGIPALLLITVCAMIALMLISRRVPFPRVWLFMLPAYLIAAASTIPPHRLIEPLAVVIAIATAFMATRSVAYEDPTMLDVPAVGAFVQQQMPGGTSLLVFGPLDAPMKFAVPEQRLIIDRFDSRAGDVRQQVESRKQVWVLIGNAPHDVDAWNALGMQRSLQPVRTFRHATIFRID